MSPQDDQQAATEQARDRGPNEERAGDGKRDGGKAKRVKPDGATHLQDEKPDDIEEGIVIAEAKVSDFALAEAIPDPTDEVLLSPNRTPGMPQGGWEGVTIHTEEGWHDPSVAWLRNPASQASAHFCIRRDGHIVQLVFERDRAWHARSSGMFHLGIEHEGGCGLGPVPILWKTTPDADRLRDDDAMLLASARLTAYLCTKYSIPVQHDFGLPVRRDTESHIAGHDQMMNNDHRDPGGKFPWKAYMNKVRELTTGDAPTPVKPTKPVVGDRRGADEIMGKPIFPKEKVLAWATSNGAAAPALEMIPRIYFYAAKKNIGADFLSIQMCHETGFGRYGGASRAFNPAGIKTRNATADSPQDFEVPQTADEGARMLVNHWCAVLGLEPIGVPHGRFEVARAVYQQRPKITLISQLGRGNWATDPAYAAKIKAHLAELGPVPGGGGGGGDADPMARKVEAAIDFGRKILGTPYGAGWKAGTWPGGSSLYSEFAPQKWTLEYVKSHQCICTGLANLCAMHGAGVPPAGVREGDGFPGGTAAYFRTYGRRRGTQPYVPSKIYPRGWLLGSPYQAPDLHLQGHVAISLGDGLILQSTSFEGVSDRQTAARCHTDMINACGTGFTYAVPPEVWLA